MKNLSKVVSTIKYQKIIVVRFISARCILRLEILKRAIVRYAACFLNLKTRLLNPTTMKIVMRIVMERMIIIALRQNLSKAASTTKYQMIITVRFIFALCILRSEMLKRVTAQYAACFCSLKTKLLTQATMKTVMRIVMERVMIAAR